MTSTSQASRSTGAHRSRRIATGLLAVVALAAAACGGNSSATTSTTSAVAGAVLVTPPHLAMQGCDYVINGQVPAGAAGGIQPPFTLAGPDPAGRAAIAHIAVHGGTGLVNGFTLPPGVALYAGPDAASTPVATIPGARSLFIADPVLWTTSGGADWLATFIACGGPGLYWIDVAQIGRANHNAGLTVTTSIATLRAAAPYPGSGTASTLPITITKQQFTWVNPAVTFAIGRGQYLGF